MVNVTVLATIENIEDVYDVEAGARSVEQVRKVEVANAQVSMGAIMLSMPKRLIP